MPLKPNDDQRVTEMPSNGSSDMGLAGEMAVPPDDIVFGCTPAMLAIRQQLEKVCGTNIPVLVQGDGGSGKEILARWMHSRSPWSSGPFVKVNFAAIPGGLFESELFGYKAGAFTGANATRIGLVEMAQGGTLFLDQITDLELNFQAKLLQLLQDGIFTRLGDQEERRLEARIICASTRQVGEAVKSGHFRQDLYYRINVICINLPSLRERYEDIALLTEYFLEQLNARFERDTPPLPKEVIDSLSSRAWRGNIRELKNLVARYAILGSLDAVDPELPARRSSAFPRSATTDGIIPLKRIAKQAVREMEGNLILQALRENKWNRRKAAQALSISYRALIYKIREAGLSQRNNRKRPQTELPRDRAAEME
jgi:two-component system response regulator AtoC